MSVVGIGNDIVQISRIANMADKARARLAIRVLTPREHAHYLTLKQPERFLAKRWAGKEAAAKALGRGIADGISFQHFDIISLPSGQPILEISGRALEIAKTLNANSWHISLSDEQKYALAFVVLSK
ncbi:holo-ACP synthase [Thalassotalea fonticola]|uniref:Holo-[acyl-carrier-protein] synthase n=1 Tax=Thalassotalea fonticola TaxID=3065649 RepID=A0ABZ0GN40_9GAMM|nr:holo-ACP synthase [Colwelliaceae bacterium S1-1]